MMKRALRNNNKLYFTPSGKSQERLSVIEVHVRQGLMFMLYMIGALPRRLRALHNNNKPNFSPSGKSQERLNLIDRSTRLITFTLYMIGPLPMRMRALPQSFWQEPKNIQNSSMSTEGTLESLPPLFHNANNTSYDVSNVRPVTPPEEKHLPRPPKEPKLVISSPPEQLLTKLFETVEEDKTKKFVIRRGR